MCPYEAARAEHLIRHFYSHKVDWFANAPKDRLYYLAKKKFPIMIGKPHGVNKTDVDWVYCLGCNKGSCKGIKGHFPSIWVEEHYSSSPECILKWDKYAKLYVGDEDEPTEAPQSISTPQMTHVCPVEKRVVYVNVETCAHCTTTEEGIAEVQTECTKAKAMIEQYEAWKTDYERLFITHRESVGEFDSTDTTVEQRRLIKMLKNVIKDMGALLDRAPYEEEN